MTIRRLVLLNQRNLKFPLQAVSRLTFMLVFALAMAGTAVAQAVPPKVGPYGFLLNTAYTDASSQGGVGLLGVINFDGVGGITGTYTLELGTPNGTGAPVTASGKLTGTYSPNPDGLTWTTILNLDVATDNGPAVVTGIFAMVVNDQGRGLQMALTGCAGFLCDNLSGNVVSAIGEVQSGGSVKTIQKGFLTGSYGMQSTKNVPSPQTSVEVWNFNPNGTVTLSGTYVQPPLPGSADFPGPHSVPVSFQGTYTVDSNGSGLITIPPPPGGQNTKTFVFVITNGHSGILALQTNRAGDGVEYLTGSLQ